MIGKPMQKKNKITSIWEYATLKVMSCQNTK